MQPRFFLPVVFLDRVTRRRELFAMDGREEIVMAKKLRFMLPILAVFLFIGLSFTANAGKPGDPAPEPSTGPARMIVPAMTLLVEFRFSRSPQSTPCGADPKTASKSVTLGSATTRYSLPSLMQTLEISMRLAKPGLII